MKNVPLFVIFYTLPFITLGQVDDWDSSVQNINDKLNKINRIVHTSNYNDYWADSDSLSIVNNSDFEKVYLTLYHTELDSNSEMDYYVVGMDVPLLELTNLEKHDQQILLVWSRYCNFDTTQESQSIKLNISSEKASDKIFLAFEKLLYIRNSYHNELHESNQCTLEKF